MTTALLSYDEAAPLLRISRTKLERLVRERKIAFVKVGSRVFFTEADLDAFIEAQTVRPVERPTSAGRPVLRRAGRAGGPNLSVIGRAR